jgi:hypothetical protein
VKKILLGTMLVLLFVGFLAPAIHVPQTRGDGVHDVGITAVNVSKTIIGGGYDANVTATVADLGDYSETFNLTVYANATCAASQNVTLASQDSENVTLTWDTTGFAYGNYTVSAYAWPVPGETNTTDNNCTGGFVTVSIVGDVTGPNGWPDGKVDMRDMGYIARCFNCKPSDDMWKPNADIVDEGIVDMRDIRAAARNFGQKVSFFNQQTPTDPETTGFAGVKATIIMNSLSISEGGAYGVPQMNLWYKAGGNYYWLQTMLYYSNELGYVAPGYPQDGFMLQVCAWIFGTPYTYKLPGSYGNFFFLVTTPIRFALFTFIGADLDIHTELYMYGNLLAVNVDWQKDLSIPLPRATAGAQFMKLREFFSDPNLILWPFCNQIIFMEPAPVSMHGNGGILSTDGNVTVQTFINGTFQYPSLALVLSNISNIIPKYPPYSNNSAESSSHLNWQINDNTVSFSPATYSDYTGIAIVDNIP